MFAMTSILFKQFQDLLRWYDMSSVFRVWYAVVSKRLLQQYLDHDTMRFLSSILACVDADPYKSNWIRTTSLRPRQLLLLEVW